VHAAGAPSRLAPQVWPTPPAADLLPQQVQARPRPLVCEPRPASWRADSSDRGHRSSASRIRVPGVVRRDGPRLCAAQQRRLQAPSARSCPAGLRPLAGAPGAARGSPPAQRAGSLGCLRAAVHAHASSSLSLHRWGGGLVLLRSVLCASKQVRRRRPAGSATAASAAAKTTPPLQPPSPARQALKAARHPAAAQQAPWGAGAGRDVSLRRPGFCYQRGYSWGVCGCADPSPARRLPRAVPTRPLVLCTPPIDDARLAMKLQRRSDRCVPNRPQVARLLAHRVVRQPRQHVRLCAGGDRWATVGPRQAAGARRILGYIRWPRSF
jgi:hypothetical protein